MFERIKALFKDTRKDVELELLHKTDDGERMWAELYLVSLYGSGEDTTECNREYVKHVLIDTDEIDDEQAKVDVLLSEDDRPYIDIEIYRTETEIYYDPKLQVLWSEEWDRTLPRETVGVGRINHYENKYYRRDDRRV
jgi:hypothetical protein